MPSSLHLIDAGANYCEQMLMKAGYIFVAYDLDKDFPVFSFGGNPIHFCFKSIYCFPLNGNPANP